jgi:hypothetical protein
LLTFTVPTGSRRPAPGSPGMFHPNTFQCRSGGYTTPS